MTQHNAWYNVAVMRSFVLRHGVIVGVALVAIGSCVFFLINVLTRDPLEGLTQATVETGVVESIVSVSGVTRSRNTAELAFPTQGVVAAVPVKEGETVEAGTILATLGSALEANYQLRRDLSGERDIANVTVTGIDPVAEEGMTGLSEELIAGEYLTPTDEGKILLGALYTKEYASNYGDIFETIEDISVGDTVRLTSGSITKEFVIKGIVQSKVDEVSLNTYIPEREFRRLFNRIDRNADQIVVRLDVPEESQDLKTAMVDSGLDDLAKIQTYEEGVPKFLTDIKNTMNLLGTLIGSIGLVVASITIFIIIFINALARRRYIGILKGIGIDRRAIECAYVVQAGIYALVGSVLGVFMTYVILIPYFKANPINFPFSDGILVAPIEGTAIRFAILLVTTLIAGFIPALMIARGNTLNAILGRK